MKTDLEDLAPRTQSYYRRRERVMRRLCDGEPRCQREDCGCDDEDLEFHHVDRNEGHESGLGGQNHLQKVEEDIEDGKEIMVVSKNCHKIIHDVPPGKEYHGEGDYHE